MLLKEGLIRSLKEELAFIPIAEEVKKRINLTYDNPDVIAYVHFVNANKIADWTGAGNGKGDFVNGEFVNDLTDGGTPGWIALDLSKYKTIKISYKIIGGLDKCYAIAIPKDKFNITTEENSRYVYASVSDTGVPVPSDTIPVYYKYNVDGEFSDSFIIYPEQLSNKVIKIVCVPKNGGKSILAVDIMEEKEKAFKASPGLILGGILVLAGLGYLWNKFKNR